ncbi:MAG: hypothetical protein ACXAC7_07285 [Candidatus Hodarchaeales archaeon]|jgi:hypothetical protein
MSQININGAQKISSSKDMQDVLIETLYYFKDDLPEEIDYPAFQKNKARKRFVRNFAKSNSFTKAIESLRLTIKDYFKVELKPASDPEEEKLPTEDKFHIKEDLEQHVHSELEPEIVQNKEIKSTSETEILSTETESPTIETKITLEETLELLGIKSISKTQQPPSRKINQIPIVSTFKISEEWLHQIIEKIDNASISETHLKKFLKTYKTLKLRPDLKKIYVKALKNLTKFPNN